MGVRTRFAEPIPEAASFVYDAKLIDESGAGLDPASIATVKLTLYNEADGQIINNRDHQDIRSMLSAGGALRIPFESADSAIIDPTEDLECHVALIEWTWPVNKSGRHEMAFLVKNMSKVP